MYDRLSRRYFLAAAASFAASSCDQDSLGRQKISFRHGVASGDPLHDRVIIWTRVTTPNWDDDVEVKWQVASDPKMRRVVARGHASANVSRDFTVKVDVDGLAPAHSYYFQFSAAGAALIHWTDAHAPARTVRMRHALPWCPVRTCRQACSTSMR